MDVKQPVQSTIEPPAASWASAGVSALERGLSVLDALGSAGAPIGLADLSKRTGLYKSTLLRLLASLERCRYAVRQADGRYRLGPVLLQLGHAYSSGFDLRAALEPSLTRLAAATREAASFFVREGNGRLCLARVEGRQEVRDWVTVGTVLPLQGAAGHVLRAFESGYRPGLPLIHGSFGERTPEVAAISAPVFRSGPLLAGALTVSGTCTRFRDENHRADIVAVLRREAEALTAELDGDRAGFRED
ncbi:IclR family transcriptional regulator [Roseomonas chloroacetimidivorans]|jgi:DNA-binding IclR family transcriptional regulator|uniref:IclR family transcriptional regulator n=1 Tax=Roseomonas chloroacetimidivorans TaxID=1766656 RepID=UPI003C7367B4